MALLSNDIYLLLQEVQPSLDTDLDLITKNMAVDEDMGDAAIMDTEEMLYTVLITIIRSIRMVTVQDMVVEAMEATGMVAIYAMENTVTASTSATNMER